MDGQPPEVVPITVPTRITLPESLHHLPLKIIINSSSSNNNNTIRIPLPLPLNNVKSNICKLKLFELPAEEADVDEPGRNPAYSTEVPYPTLPPFTNIPVRLTFCIPNKVRINSTVNLHRDTKFSYLRSRINKSNFSFHSAI